MKQRLFIPEMLINNTSQKVFLHLRFNSFIQSNWIHFQGKIIRLTTILSLSTLSSNMIFENIKIKIICIILYVICASNVNLNAQSSFWEKKLESPDTWFFNLAFDSNRNPFALAYNRITYSTNLGEDWIDLYPPYQPTYRDILIDNINSLYLARTGEPAGIVKSTDFGLTWNNLEFWNSMSASRLFEETSNIYAGSWNGVFKSTDRGNTWELFKYHSNVTTFINKKDSIVLIGSPYELIFSTNNGLNWQEKGFNVNNYIPYLCCGVISDNNIYVGSDSGLFISSDHGTNWEYNTIDLDISDMFTNYPGNIYLATSTGIYYSKDDGIHFKLLNDGLFSLSSTFIKYDNYGSVYVGINHDGIYKGTKSINTFLADLTTKRLVIQATGGIWDSILVENQSLDTLRVSGITSHNEIITVIPENADILPGEKKYFQFSIESLPANVYTGPVVFESNSFSSPDTLDTEVYFGVPYIEPVINFFPAETIDKFCVQDYTWWYSHGGNYGSYIKYFNNYELEDTIIMGEEYYLYDFEMRHYFNYDSVNNMLYTYIPSIDSVYLAADFTMNEGDSTILYLDGSPWKYGCSGISNIYYWGKNRKVISFSGYKDNETKQYSFLEGFGLYEHYYTYILSIFQTSSNFDVVSAVIDGVAYNPFYYTIDSTNAHTDRPLNDFPFKLNVYKNSNNSYFIDTCYTDFYVYRNDTLITKRSYLIDVNWMEPDTAIIDLDSTILKIGDLIKYQAIMKDTSIYNNYVVYPGNSEYISFKVISGILNIETDIQIKEFLLYHNFPNPFNPTTTIKYDLPKSSNVELIIYDILGRKIKTLVNETKEAGRYEVKWNASNSASGVYIYQLRAENFISTKKMLLLK